MTRFCSQTDSNVARLTVTSSAIANPRVASLGGKSNSANRALPYTAGMQAGNQVAKSVRELRKTAAYGESGIRVLYTMGTATDADGHFWLTESRTQVGSHAAAILGDMGRPR